MVEVVGREAGVVTVMGMEAGVMTVVVVREVVQEAVAKAVKGSEVQVG